MTIGRGIFERSHVLNAFTVNGFKAKLDAHKAPGILRKSVYQFKYQGLVKKTKI